MDSLVLLGILEECGKASLNPQPNDVLHFDVIFPLLNVLRQRQRPLRLVKVKSHTGFLVITRADELAEVGYSQTVQEVFSAPQKYGSLWLKVQQHFKFCALAAQCQKLLPTDSAPYQSLLKKGTGANTRRAVSKLNTTFVQQLEVRERGDECSVTVQRARERQNAECECERLPIDQTASAECSAPSVLKREKPWLISPSSAFAFSRAWATRPHTTKCAS